jgi:hypothetical protein
MSEEFKDKIKSISFAGYRYSIKGFTRDNERVNKIELDAYKQARDEGSQPWGTKLEQSEEAKRESDRLGRPFRAENLAKTYHPEITKKLSGKILSPFDKGPG